MTEPSKHALSRRGLLRAAIIGGAVSTVGLFAAQNPAHAATASLAKIRTLSSTWTPADRALYTETSAIAAYYERSLAAVTNAMVGDGPVAAGAGRHVAPRGWFTGKYWRAAASTWWNARTQEHISTLAYFLANDEPWNVEYRGNRELRLRLLAAIETYAATQLADGFFPEDSGAQSDAAVPNPTVVSGLAATAFGVQAMASTFGLLTKDRATAPAADQGAIDAALSSLRSMIGKAVATGLDPNSQLWGRAEIDVANQPIGMIAAAVLAAFEIPDDRTALLANVPATLAIIAERGISTSGHTVERKAYDYGYTANVAVPDLAVIARLAREMGRGDVATTTEDIAQQVTRFVTHTVFFEPTPGPDGSPNYVEGFHYAGLSARNTVFTFQPYDAIPGAWKAPLGKSNQTQSSLTPSRDLLAVTPEFAALHPSQEAVQAWFDNWVSDPAMYPITDWAARVLSGSRELLSPRRLLGTVQTVAPAPSDAERRASAADYPYFTAASSNTLLADTAPTAPEILPRWYGFVQRKNFHLGFQYGLNRLENLAYEGDTKARPRYGPGILWTPTRGTVVLSSNEPVAKLSGSKVVRDNEAIDRSWGTYAGKTATGYAEALTPMIATSRSASGAVMGAGESTGAFTVTAVSSAKSPVMTTTLRFNAGRVFGSMQGEQDRFVRRVQTPGRTGYHCIPLLLGPEDHIEFSVQPSAVVGAVVDSSVSGRPLVVNSQLKSTLRVSTDRFTIVTGANRANRLTFMFSEGTRASASELSFLVYEKTYLSTAKRRVVVKVPHGADFTETIVFGD